MEKNIFEIATKGKFRFPYKGMISTEDLWDLSVIELDSIFKTLNTEAKKADEESLLKTKTKLNEELSIKIDIIKHIVNIKVEEAEKKATAKKRAQEKQMILSLLEKKNAEALANKSVEELTEMLKEYDN